jgi:YebC/PmpR family DNA-binding regulatory protein
MSGHSKWATIKRKKGAADAKRGQVFTRLTREIVMAAREGGADVDSNFRLRLAVERARAQNMPKDNIERAIRRGTGADKDGVAFEQNTYEGYAPHAVALMIETVTENKNRTVAEIRHLLSRSGGNMGEAGSVGWQFTRQAYFAIPAKGVDYDSLFMLAAEAGANDVTPPEGDIIEIFAPVESFKTVSDALHAAKIAPEEAELRMIANQEMELSAEETMQVLRCIENLEELDDVQAVYSNLHISDEVMAKLEAEE